MKATELRIGNLVNYQLTDEMSDPKNWIEPMVIDAEDLRVLSLREYEEYTPIPLTEEWLKRFGFQRNREGGCVWMYKMPYYDATLQLWNGSDGIISICRAGIAAYHAECKYVHQLQNLYFALTGEELPININE